MIEDMGDCQPAAVTGALVSDQAPAGLAPTGFDPAIADALREAYATLVDHPGYAGDVTFAAIWKWLARKDAALELLAPAIAKAEGRS